MIKNNNINILSFFMFFLLIVLIIPTGLGLVHDSKSEIPLFTDMLVTDIEAKALIDCEYFMDWHYTLAVENRAIVTINKEFLSPVTLKPGDNISVNLFSEKQYTLKITEIANDINNINTIRGNVIGGGNLDYFLLSGDDKKIYLSIKLFGENTQYIVNYNGLTGRHYLNEISLNDMEWDELSAPAISPETDIFLTDSFLLPGESQFPNHHVKVQEADPLEELTIDVMVVYTSDAYNYAGDYLNGIDTAISQHLGASKEALDNSNVFVNLNLVHSGMVEYEETGDSITDLLRLTYLEDEISHPYNCMDEVHEWRDAYGADLVVLLVKDAEVLGRAWQLPDKTGNHRYGFSLTRVDALNYVFLHEIGHNMGLGHDVEQWSESKPGIFDYSAGWLWIGKDLGRYCSVMSYGVQGGYVRVPHISNPDILYEDEPTGHAQMADNARTMRETKHVVAAYRDSPLLPPALPEIVRNDIFAGNILILFEDNVGWRNNISNVYIDGVAVGHRDYNLGAGYLSFNLSHFPTSGSYELKIASRGYSYTETTLDIVVGANILDYNLPGQFGLTDIDEDKTTVNLRVPAGLELGNLTADFTISPGATIKINGVEQLSGKSANDFYGPLIYTVISADGNLIREWTVIVKEIECGSLSDLQTGDRVVDNSWKWEHRKNANYSGAGEVKAVTWIVTGRDHYGPGSGITLIAEELIGLYTFDDSTNDTPMGSNHWGNSGTDKTATHGIRPWLNSIGKYESSGFYNAFSHGFKNAVLATELPNIRTGDGESYITGDKVFIPSLKELGFADHSDDTSSVLEYFIDAVSADRKAALGGNNLSYWSRSPFPSHPFLVYFIDSAGRIGLTGDHFANSSNGGVRPLLNLGPETPVLAEPISGGFYELLTCSDNGDGDNGNDDNGKILYGDVDGSGRIDVADAILLLRHIVGLIQLEGEDLIRAKVGGEGEREPNVGDAILILRYIVGLNDSFPVEKVEKHQSQ